jgi:hypothetical protein
MQRKRTPEELATERGRARASYARKKREKAHARMNPDTFAAAQAAGMSIGKVATLIGVSHDTLKRHAEDAGVTWSVPARPVSTLAAPELVATLLNLGFRQSHLARHFGFEVSGFSVWIHQALEKTWTVRK